MIIRRLEEAIGTDREVSSEGWTSRRLLLAADQMGFSLHDTLIHAGAELELHYKNHLEAVYCVGGEGSVEVVGSGERIPLRDGTVYALDQNDQHILRADTEMRMVCVFNPPLVGNEVHDATGAYPLLTDES